MAMSGMGAPRGGAIARGVGAALAMAALLAMLAGCGTSRVHRTGASSPPSRARSEGPFA